MIAIEPHHWLWLAGTLLLVVGKPLYGICVERPSAAVVAAADKTGEKPAGEKSAPYNTPPLPPVNEQGHLILPPPAGPLRNPFDPAHPTRPEQNAGLDPAKSGAVGSKQSERQICRLTGIASGKSGERAVIERGGETIILAVGETKQGITLVAIAERSVIIRDWRGERKLALGR